ncbi:MAG: sensor histidine kinase, partial [Candidatus Kapaibacteriota bacterium]
SERLEAQNHELLALNQEKNEFLGIAAHDLKNPLNNIRDLARIIEQEFQTMPPEEVQDFARLIGQSANKMFELVRNLLDVNAIEQGGIKPHLVDFDIREIVNRVVESYTQRAMTKGITLNFTIPDEPMVSFADENLTEQIIENLISNAVKYSPFGKKVTIEISTTQQSVASNQQLLTVLIRDEGPGISADDQTKLFGKFARLTAQPTGGEHSTGLGLSIVKQLAEVMKGKVWCESVLGEGATFFVQLPMVV